MLPHYNQAVVMIKALTLLVTARPALTERPDETNTGPRQAITQTWSAQQAYDWINSSASLEEDGWRYLRRTRVQGIFRWIRLDYRNVIFEDCIFEGGLYAIEGYGVEDLPGTELPEFRYCELFGGSSATIRDGGLRMLRCNIHHGTDLVKTNGAGSEYYANYMHSTYSTPGAHCDIIQIRTGTENVWFHWNNLQGFNSDDSESGAGSTCNGVLQTGDVSNDIGPVYWYNNWLDGGHYTTRMGDEENDIHGHTVLYVWRNNRYGRNFQYGPTLSAGRVGVDFDDSNVWDDTELPVL